MLAQACEKRGRKAKDERKFEAVEEIYHFLGIGEQVITSFIKLQVPGTLGGQDVHYAPSITDGSTPPLIGNDLFLPWCSSIHLYPGDCWLEIPSRGIKAKLMVTTSNHVLLNMADFGDDHEIDGSVAGKRSHDDDNGRTSGTSAPSECDADAVPVKSRRGGAFHKSRPPRKNNPLAFIQQSRALSEMKKLQQVSTRESCLSKAVWEKVCKAANKAISLI